MTGPNRIVDGHDVGKIRDETIKYFLDRAERELIEIEVEIAKLDRERRAWRITQDEMRAEWQRRHPGE